VIKWRQVDDYHAVSDCGSYKVCRIVWGGAMFYEAWRGKTFLARAEDSDSKAMRKVCQQDAAKFTGAGALLACQRAAEGEVDHG
jgi:hypothetical protein